MKKILLAATFFLCVNSTFASETAILKIKGTLTSPACTPNLAMAVWWTTATSA